MRTGPTHNVRHNDFLVDPLVSADRRAPVGGITANFLLIAARAIRLSKPARIKRGCCEHRCSENCTPGNGFGRTSIEPPTARLWPHLFNLLGRRMILPLVLNMLPRNFRYVSASAILCLPLTNCWLPRVDAGTRFARNAPGPASAMGLDAGQGPARSAIGRLSFPRSNLPSTHCARLWSPS